MIKTAVPRQPAIPPIIEGSSSVTKWNEYEGTCTCPVGNCDKRIQTKCVYQWHAKLGDDGFCGIMSRWNQRRGVESDGRPKLFAPSIT
eukprot:scaffold5502_cov115-Cylindrotheca_fusiformis.AAC.8